MTGAGLVKGKKLALSAVSSCSALAPVRPIDSQQTGKPDQPRSCLRKEHCLQMFTGAWSAEAGILAGSLVLSLELPEVPSSSHHVHLYHWASGPFAPKLVYPSEGPESPTVVLYGHVAWGQRSTCGETRSVQCWFA